MSLHSFEAPPHINDVCEEIRLKLEHLSAEDVISVLGSMLAGYLSANYSNPKDVMADISDGILMAIDRYDMLPMREACNE